MTASPRSMQCASCEEQGFRGSNLAPIEPSSTCLAPPELGLSFSGDDVESVATGLRPENGATRKPEAMALWGVSTAGPGLEFVGVWKRPVRLCKRDKPMSRIPNALAAQAAAPPTNSGPQCMAYGVHASRGRRADLKHIAREGARPSDEQHRLLRRSIAPQLFSVTKDADTSLYTQVQPFRRTFTRRMRRGR